MAKKNNNASSNSKTRANAAKEVAARLRAQEESKAARSRYIFAGVIVFIALLLVSVIVYLFLNNPKDPNKIKNDIAGVEQPSNLNDDYSFTISKLGGGKSAEIPGKPVLDIYNDFICPACGYFDRQYGAAIGQLVSEGSVNVHYHPLAWFDNTSPVVSASSSKHAEERSQGHFSDMYSTRSASAAYYLMEKAPNQYLDFVRSMYQIGNEPCEGWGDNTPNWDSRSTCETQTPTSRGYHPEDGTNEKIEEFIIEAGISSDIAKEAVESGKYRKFAEKVATYVSAQHIVTATPFIALNGVKWCSGQQDKDSYLEANPKAKTIDDFYSTMDTDKFAEYVRNYKG